MPESSLSDYVPADRVWRPYQRLCQAGAGGVVQPRNSRSWRCCTAEQQQELAVLHACVADSALTLPFPQHQAQPVTNVTITTAAMPLPPPLLPTTATTSSPTATTTSHRVLSAVVQFTQQHAGAASSPIAAPAFRGGAQQTGCVQYRCADGPFPREQQQFRQHKQEGVTGVARLPKERRGWCVWHPTWHASAATRLTLHPY